MDSTFSPLGFLIFGISLSFYAFVVQSQLQDEQGSQFQQPQPPVFMSPPPPPPPPPPTTPPPPLAPGSPTPPRLPQQNPPPNQTGSPKPRSIRSGHHRRRRRHHFPPPPPPQPHGMNAGKKVGLLFVGFAAIMQVGFVGFLVFKRRELLKNSDNRYEDCS